MHVTSKNSISETETRQPRQSSTPSHTLGRHPAPHRRIIASAGRCQRAGDLLLIAVKPEREDQEDAYKVARCDGYEVLEADTGLLEACFRFGYPDPSDGGRVPL